MKNSLQPDKTLSFMESSVGDLPLQFVERVKSSLVHINETFIKCAMLNLGYSRQRLILRDDLVSTFKALILSYLRNVCAK